MLRCTLHPQVQAYIDDPLNYHGSMKAGWGCASIKAISNFRPQVKDIQLPLLVIHGTDDHLVPISASEFIASTVSSSGVRYEVCCSSQHHDYLTVVRGYGESSLSAFYQLIL